ncbi:MAG TPA: nuclear transport factor 2 family protein [Thermomicrobiales bacterium]|nr:nuclear transport factor 2 family protein [Thermomicrobiales bacterium]
MGASIAATDTRTVIIRFNEAFDRHDVAAISALMTDDVIFENTSPFPDGERFEGNAAVSAFWQRFFDESPQAHFDAEEMIVMGDRAVVRWRYSWGTGHVRGIDLFRVRDGKVAEKLAYVKG